MKISLIHDHLTQKGGAERVLEAMQAIYPKAPTFTLLYDKNVMDDTFGHKNIQTSFLQKLPFSISHPRWYLPIMPTAVEHYNLSNFNVIISSSSAFSKGVIGNTDSIHICYCHTPTRYLWSDTHDYVENLKIPNIGKALLYPILTKLRNWDKLAADRVDFFISNSKTVSRRIKKFYNRDSVVIHPPVDTHTFKISHKPKEYYLIGGRLVPYKRYDMVVTAFNKLGLPLKIFGSGPNEKDLKKMAGSNIEFLGRVSDEHRAHLFSNAIAFIHPQEEDFGITPVESMASGRPVIAYAKGGAVETVIDGKTGTLFYEQSWEELADTVLHFDHKKFDPEYIKKHAEKFSLNTFRKKLSDFIDEAWKNHKQETLIKR